MTRDAFAADGGLTLYPQVHSVPPTMQRAGCLPSVSALAGVSTFSSSTVAVTRTTTASQTPIVPLETVSYPNMFKLSPTYADPVSGIEKMVGTHDMHKLESNHRIPKGNG